MIKMVEPSHQSIGTHRPLYEVQRPKGSNKNPREPYFELSV